MSTSGDEAVPHPSDRKLDSSAIISTNKEGNVVLFNGGASSLFRI